MDTITLPDTTGPDDRDLLDIQRAIGYARLLADVGDDASARTALRQAMTRLAAIIGALAVAAAVLVAAPAPAAQAQVIPLVQPVPLVLAGPTATLSTTVVATAKVTDVGGHRVAVSAPLNGSQRRVGVWGASTAVVRVTAAVPTAALPIGRQTWMARDLGDGTLTSLAVDARAATRLIAPSATIGGGGITWVDAQVVQWSPRAGRWVPAAGAQVRVQAPGVRGWVTVRTVTVGGGGWVTAAVVGGHDRLRIVRAATPTAWSAAAVVSVIGAPGR
jgi:hypothetical protein